MAQPISEISIKAFACHLPENEARTINGVIIEELGDLPVVGAKITIDGYVNLKCWKCKTM